MTEEMRKNEAEKANKLPYIIAVDFDGTLVTDKFPLIGDIKTRIWNAVQDAQRNGCKIILWTCRTGETLDEAIQFCKEHNLEFDAVNDNIEETKSLGWFARKVYANLYLDDKAALLDHNFGIVGIPTLEVNHLE